MKRILVCNLRLDFPECRLAESVHMPYGLGIIMEVMDRAGVSYDCFDTYAAGSTDDFLSYYAREKHEVLLFSAIVGNHAYPFLHFVFTRIKLIRPDAMIVLGGPLTSIYPEILLRRLPADVIVIGEAEAAFRTLLDREFVLGSDAAAIPGLGFRREGEPCITPPAPALKTPLEMTSSIPLYEHPGLRPLLDKYVDGLHRRERGWDLNVTRGCHGNCTFCKRIFDKPLRNFSASYVVDRMMYLTRRHGIRKFNTLDENLCSMGRLLREFLDLLDEKGLEVRWRARSRMDNIPVHELDRSMRLGLCVVLVGIESGSQRILDEYGKRARLDDHREALRETARRGLLEATFIVGAEGESEETVRETEELIRYLGLRRRDYSVSYLTPIPGTPLFESLVERGVIPDRESALWSYMGDFNSLEMNISPFTDEQLIAARKRLTEAGRVE